MSQGSCLVEGVGISLFHYVTCFQQEELQQDIQRRWQQQSHPVGREAISSDYLVFNREVLEA